MSTPDGFFEKDLFGREIESDPEAVIEEEEIKPKRKDDDDQLKLPIEV